MRRPEHIPGCLGKLLGAEHVMPRRELSPRCLVNVCREWVVSAALNNSLVHRGKLLGVIMVCVAHKISLVARVSYCARVFGVPPR